MLIELTVSRCIKGWEFFSAFTIASAIDRSFLVVVRFLLSDYHLNILLAVVVVVVFKLQYLFIYLFNLNKLLNILFTFYIKK